jgi:hypothetical protein
MTTVRLADGNDALPSGGTGISLTNPAAHVEVFTCLRVRIAEDGFIIVQATDVTIQPRVMTAESKPLTLCEYSVKNTY